LYRRLPGGALEAAAAKEEVEPGCEWQPRGVAVGPGDARRMSIPLPLPSAIRTSVSGGPGRSWGGSGSGNGDGDGDSDGGGGGGGGEGEAGGSGGRLFEVRHELRVELVADLAVMTGSNLCVSLPVVVVCAAPPPSPSRPPQAS
jgi:hypothetical protein